MSQDDNNSSSSSSGGTRTALEGVLFNLSRLHFKSSCKHTFYNKEGYLNIVHKKGSFNEYYVFEIPNVISGQFFNVYDMKVHLNRDQSLFFDESTEDLMNRHFESEVMIDVVSCDRVVSMYDCQSVGVNRFEVFQNDDTIYLFGVPVFTRSTHVVFVLDLRTFAVSQHELTYGNKATIFAAKILRVIPVYSPRENALYALVEQSGEEGTFFSYGEIDLGRMTLERYIHRLVSSYRRTSSARQQTLVIGQSVLIVSSDGVLQVSENSTKLTPFDKNDIVQLQTNHWSSHSNLIRFYHPIKFDQNTAIIFTSSRVFMYDCTARSISTISVQTPATLALFDKGTLQVFSLRRNGIDLPKFYVSPVAGDNNELLQIDLSFVDVIRNTVEARTASLNRDLYRYAMLKGEWSDCMIVTSDQEEIPAHKIILANRAPALLKLIDETNRIHVALDSNEASSLLTYIYSSVEPRDKQLLLDVKTLLGENSRVLNPSIDSWKRDEFFDIQFNFNKTEKKVQSHGIAWHCCSTFVRDLYECRGDDTGDNIKVLINVDSHIEQATEAVFMYIDEWVHTRRNDLSVLSPDSILELINVAGFFGIDLLLFQCQQYLCNKFNEFSLRTCIFIIDVAKRYNLHMLYSLAFDVIAEGASSVFLKDRRILFETVGRNVAQEFIEISEQIKYLRNHKNKKIVPHDFYEVPYNFLDNETPAVVTNSGKFNVPLNRERWLILGEAHESLDGISLLRGELDSKGAVWLKEKLNLEQKLKIDISVRFPQDPQCAPLRIQLHDRGYSTLMIPEVLVQEQLLWIEISRGADKGVKLSYSFAGQVIKDRNLGIEASSPMTIQITLAKDGLRMLMNTREVARVPQTTVSSSKSYIFGFTSNHGTTCPPCPEICGLQYSREEETESESN